MSGIGRWWRDRGIGTKLIVVCLAVGIIPMAVLGVLAVRTATGALERNAEQAQQEVAFNAVDKLDRNLFERYGDVQAFAASDPAQSMDPERVAAWIDRMMGIYTPIYNLMVVADADGRVIAANTVDVDGERIDSSGIIGTDVSDASWFTAATDPALEPGTTVVEDVHADDLAGAVFGADAPEADAMSFTYPIRDDAGNVVGVWTNRFNWAAAQAIVTQVAERAHEGGAGSVQVHIVDDERLVLADSADPADVMTETLAVSDDLLAGEVASQGFETYPGVGWTLVATQDRSEALADATQLRNVALVIAAVAILIIAGLAWLFARSISRPLNTMVAAAEGIAQGDVDQRIDVQGADEIGRLGAAFRGMLGYLQDLSGVAQRIARGDLTATPTPRSEKDALGVAFGEMTRNLRETVGEVTASADMVATGSDEMARAAEEVGGAVTQIASSVGEVAAGATDQVATVAQAKDSVDRANEQAAEARQAAERGVAIAAATGDAMDEVISSSQETVSAIGRLGTMSTEIGGIVGTISTIAEQTNLLALNAAIEAARAGEQGRGFAVVAEEVRKLAEESRTAATAISELIEQVQKETETAVRVVDAGGARIGEGATRVREAREAFETIGAGVDATNAAIRDLVAATDQVTAVSEQTSAAAEEVSATTEETSAATEEIAAQAAELARQAESLRAAVSRFTL